MDKLQLYDDYKPLLHNPPDYRYLILTGGRASSKSFHVAIACLNYTYEPGHVILYTRYTLTSAHDSIIPEFIEKIELLNKEADFTINKTDIVNNHTGSRILFRGIKTSSGNQTAKLKSLHGITDWVLEEAEEMQEAEDFETIDDSIRTAKIPNRIIVVMNPSFKKHFVYQKFIEKKRADTVHIHTDYRINWDNLDENYRNKILETKKANPLRYEHVYLGRWLEDREGLLWTRQIIDRSRVAVVPTLRRVVIGIDPAISSDPNKSDETGIIAAGVDENGNGYLLEDGSGHYTPTGWATEAKRLAEKWNADCYVAEKNQGGDMVQTVIRQVDTSTRVKLVTATKGKFVRAEPVFSYYEQLRIFHVGTFTKLEAQMITFNPDKTKQSPDRVDALVWAFTDLILPESQLFSFTSDD